MTLLSLQKIWETHKIIGGNNEHIMPSKLVVASWLLPAYAETELKPVSVTLTVVLAGGGCRDSIIGWLIAVELLENRKQKKVVIISTN